MEKISFHDSQGVVDVALLLEEEAARQDLGLGCVTPRLSLSLWAACSVLTHGCASQQHSALAGGPLEPVGSGAVTWEVGLGEGIVALSSLLLGLAHPFGGRRLPASEFSNAHCFGLEYSRLPKACWIFLALFQTGMWTILPEETDPAYSV